MKKFSSEFAHSYDTYSFGYTTYAVLEEGEALCSAYEQGFLPYSAAKLQKRTMYMARSARIPLKDFVLTSENRRIAKKFDDQLTRTETPIAEHKSDDAFYTFCTEYFKQRFGDKVMPRERLETILATGFVSHIVTYRDAANNIVAYVLEVRDSDMTHFWFSFYDLNHIRQSLGLWLMLDAARNAKARRDLYFYLGTVYGEKALYKTNFEPLEFWDGSSWINNPTLLRELSRTDHTRTHEGMDRWKEGQERF